MTASTLAKLFTLPPSIPSFSPVAPLAPFFPRLVAAIIDYFILAFLNYNFLLLTTGKGFEANNGWLNVLILTLDFLYFVYLESAPRQASFGKMLLGIRVVDINGSRLTFLNSLARNAGKILSLIVLGIGFLMPLWTEKRQALHDILAGTVVVKK